MLHNLSQENQRFRITKTKNACNSLQTRFSNKRTAEILFSIFIVVMECIEWIDEEYGETI